MNQHELDKGITNLKHLKMTSTEKGEILKRVLTTPVISLYTPKQTWLYGPQSFRTQFAYYSMGILLLFIAGGSGLAYASENTIPGDLLYPIKIHVTEPIHAMFALTPLAKAQWDATVTSHRLDEAQKLSNKNKLTPQYQAELSTSIDQNLTAFQQDSASLSTSTGQKGEVDDLLQNTLQNHTAIIQKLSLQNKEEDIFPGNHSPKNMASTSVHEENINTPAPQDISPNSIFKKNTVSPNDDYSSEGDRTDEGGR